MFKAVVYTTGRTGSRLICKNLADHFGVANGHDRDKNILDGVVHAHNPLWGPPGPGWWCVLSRRRDLFAAVMSTMIGRVTNEFENYTGHKIDPQYVDIQDFVDCVWFMRCFYQAIDLSKFSQVIDIYYEDLMLDPGHLFRHFGIDKSIDYTLSQRAPYRYQDLIINHDDVKTVFDEIMLQPVTPDQINCLKNTIESDLNTVHQQLKLTKDHQQA